MTKQYIHHVPGTKLNPKTDCIKISSHTGYWYVVDSMHDDSNDRMLFELEHETYGDEAAHIIVDENGVVIIEDVWNGFDDYFEAI